MTTAVEIAQVSRRLLEVLDRQQCNTNCGTDWQTIEERAEKLSELISEILD
jgi:hypothetical protein